MKGWTSRTLVTSNRRRPFSSGKARISVLGWVYSWLEDNCFLLPFSGKLWISMFFPFQNESANLTTQWTTTLKIPYVLALLNLIRLLNSLGHRNKLLCSCFPFVVIPFIHRRWCIRQDFQFFPPELAKLQERELAVYKVCLASFRLRSPSLTSFVEVERNTSCC